LPISIPPIAPQSSSSIICGWYNRPNSGRIAKWTQSHPHEERNPSFYADVIQVVSFSLISRPEIFTGFSSVLYGIDAWEAYPSFAVQ
jgi:hypothetical protein